MKEHLSMLTVSQLIFAWLLVLSSHVYAATSGEDETGKIIGKNVSLGVTPFSGYTPETKLIVGIAGIYAFRITEQSPPSSIPIAALYTQRKQYQVALIPEFYLKDGDYHIQSTGMGVLKYPELFYGIGNDTSEDAEEDYTKKTTCIRLNLQKRILTMLNIGIQCDFEKNEVIEVEENGLLAIQAEDRITGSEGGWASGIGVTE